MEKKTGCIDFLRRHYAHIALLTVGAAVHIAGCFQSSLWFDEAYTVGLMNHSLADMLKWSTNDVHPHLYYIMLWLVTRVFGVKLSVMRLFSALGTMLFASLGLTHIRRDFGKKCGFWFSFCALFSTSMLVYTNQIRMYSFAAYFITLAAIYAYRLFKSPEIMRIRVLFVISSVCAAYTHYFALFTVAAINITLLVGLIKSKHPHPFKSWLATGIAQIALYIPGGLVFLHQMMIGGAAWISIGWPDLVFDLVSYHWTGSLLSEMYPHKSNLYFVLGGIYLALYILFAIAIRHFTRDDSVDADKKSAVRGAAASYYGVLIFALTVSLFRPIYYARYTMVLSGLLFFFAAFLLSSFGKRLSKALVASLLAVIFSLHAVHYFGVYYDESSHQLENALSDEVVETDTFLFESIHGFVASVAYPENNAYFYDIDGWGVENVYPAFGPNAGVLNSLDCDEINSLSGRVWVVNRGECFKKLESLGYTAAESQNIGMRYHYSLNFELILMVRE